MVIPENSSIVIFGASGDLTYRKLIPALYHLYASQQLPKSFAILGVSRTEYRSLHAACALSSAEHLRSS